MVSAQVACVTIWRAGLTRTNGQPLQALGLSFYGQGLAAGGVLNFSLNVTNASNPPATRVADLRRNDYLTSTSSSSSSSVRRPRRLVLFDIDWQCRQCSRTAFGVALVRLGSRGAIANSRSASNQPGGIRRLSLLLCVALPAFEFMRQPLRRTSTRDLPGKARRICV